MGKAARGAVAARGLVVMTGGDVTVKVWFVFDAAEVVRVTPIG